MIDLISRSKARKGTNSAQAFSHSLMMAGQPPPRSACAGPAGPARTSSATASRSPTSCGRTCATSSPARPALFAELDSPISLAFLGRFTTQDRADWLSPNRLGKPGCARVGYSGRTDPAVLHARLLAAPRGISRPSPPPPGRCHPRAASPYCAPSTPRSRPWPPASATSSPRHPDPTSSPACPAPEPSAPPACSPRSATPAADSPPADSLACLAGVAPSTRQSGKVRPSPSAGARQAAPRRRLDFAGDSRHANPWAADLYQRARARGHDHPHAVRILARAWALRHLALLARPPPTTPPGTGHSRPCSTKINRRQLDTGLLIDGPPWQVSWDAGRSRRR